MRAKGAGSKIASKKKDSVLESLSLTKKNENKSEESEGSIEKKKNEDVS